MNVTVGAELWVTQEVDGTLLLHPPTVTNHQTGQGIPGILAPHARPLAIINEGTIVELEVRRQQKPRLTFGCTACLDVAFGRPPRNQLAHEHHHPPVR